MRVIPAHQQKHSFQMELRRTSIAHTLCLQFHKQLHKAFVHKPNMSPPLPYLLQYLRIFFNSVFIIWSKLKDENFGDIINCINIVYVNTMQQIQYCKECHNHANTIPNIQLLHTALKGFLFNFSSKTFLVMKQSWVGLWL